VEAVEAEVGVEVGASGELEEVEEVEEVEEDEEDEEDEGRSPEVLALASVVEPSVGALTGGS
jgi:hypothetical protein